MVSGRPGQRGDADRDHRAGNQPARQAAHRNSRPPAAADDQRLERAENFGAVGNRRRIIDAGIRLTPPYGKSAHRGTNAPRDCSNARASLIGRRRRSIAGKQWRPRGPRAPGNTIEHADGRRPAEGRRHFAFSLSANSFLHAERNFLRSLPLSPLSSACLEHSSEPAVRGFSAFFSGRRLGFGLGRLGLGSRRRGLRRRGAHQQKRSNGGRGDKGRDLRHGAPRIEDKGATVAPQC